MNIQAVLRAVTRWSIYASFFFVPLFFLPIGTGVLEVNKQALLVLLTFVLALGWLGSLVAGKRFVVRRGWINLLPVLFFLGAFVSSVLSRSGYQTWVGQSNQEYASFLTLGALLFQFYAVRNSGSEPSVRRGIFLSLLASSVIAGLVGAMGLVGIAHLPFSFAQSSSFNTVGSPNGLAIVLLASAFLSLAAWLVSGRGEEGLVWLSGPLGLLTRVLMVLVTSLALFFAFAIDSWVLWTLCILGVLSLVGFGLLRSGTFLDSRRFAFPLLLLLVSVLFLFVRTPLQSKLPISVSPSFSASWQIARSVMSEGWRQAAFGSGPGTFAFDYAKYRPDSVNATVFWNTRFDQSASYVLTMLSTFGGVGTALWLLFMGSVGVLSLAYLIRERGGREWNAAYAVFSGWLLLFAGHILYSSNMTLSFLLWGLTGLLSVQIGSRERNVDVSASPRAGLALSFGAVSAVTVAIAALFAVGGKYAGEIAFSEALRLDRANAPIGDVIAQLNRAVSYNSLSDVYYRNLASAFLVQAREIIADADVANPTADQRAAASNAVASSVNAAKRATDLGPNNVSNWAVRGSIYRDVMPLVKNAEDFAAATFERARALEPGNPSRQVDLGRVYLAVAERARQLKTADDSDLAATATQSETDRLASAEQSFLAAIQLKPDYAPAHYYLAATYERQGRIDDAITRLVALRAARPDDVGLGFQLSMLYVRQKQYDEARAELERIVQISPKYSNALWFLSSLYEINGNHDKAIDTLRKVKELNPDNAMVADRLAQLESGQSATDIPGPVEEEGEGAVTGADQEASAVPAVEGVGATGGNP